MATFPPQATIVYIDGSVPQTHAAERPRGRACPVCSQLNRAGQRGGSGNSVPRPAVCVRASSHTSSNNGKKEVSTTTTQKAMRGPWTCGARKMGRNKKREDGGKNLGPSLIGEGHTQVEGEEDNFHYLGYGPSLVASRIYVSALISSEILARSKMAYILHVL